MSPRIALRSDIEKFRSALQIGKNFIITPQGGILMREGFKNQAETTDTANPSRCFQFHNGGDISDMQLVVTAGDSLIHFYIDGVIQADTVAHNYLQSELEDLHFTNQETTAVINHADHPPLYIEIALDGSISGEELASNLIPLADYDDASSPTATTLGDANYALDWIGIAPIDFPWNPSRHWTLKYDGVWAAGNAGNPKEFEFSSVAATLAARIEEAMFLIPALRGAGTSVTALPGIMGTDWTIIDVTIAGEAGGKLLEIISVNHSEERYVEIEASVDEQDVIEPAWSFPTYVLDGGNYFQCIKAHTPATITTADTIYWTNIGAVKPITFDWQYPSGNAWDIAAVHYSPGGRGFPTIGVINQQRMLLMANPGFRMGIFGSRINKYKDFIRGPQDDDPFFFALDTTDSPTIKWATAQRSLLIGTSSGDYAVKAGVTLTPSDVQADKQNAARSHNTPAIAINTDVFYIEQGKEKVRTTAYNRDTVDAQTSTDISLIAEHLLHSRVKRLALLQTPEVLVIGLRDDGSLVGIAYSPDAGTGAWFEFESQGVVVDICGGYSVINNEDELWALITYDGGVTHHLEKMPYPKRVFTIPVDASDDHLVDQGMVLLDGWITGTIVVGDSNVITGLSQFEGLTVAATVDDAWTGEYLVTDGAIILDAPPEVDVDAYSGTYAVGLSYEANATTFEVADGNPKGVAFGTKRRWNKLYLKTIDSAIPKINGQLPEDRHPDTNMGVAEIIQAGLHELEVINTSWGDGSITILQDRPYPTHILGFFGEIEANNA